jgi:hypothetical protein
VTLRTRLILIVAVTLAPMVVCALAAALPLLEHERRVMERDAVGRARSAMSAVDAHLNGTLLAMRALATSRNLEAGDVAAFHAETQRALKGDPAWVNIGLIAPERGVLFNAVYAFGQPEPLPPQDDSMQVTANGTRTGFGNVRIGTVVRNPTVRITLPISYDGNMRYMMTAPLNMRRLADVLQAQKLPESWTIAVLDREKHVIAALPAQPTGTNAQEGLRKAIERSPEGWTLGGGAPGAPYTAHVTSDLSGWVLAIGVPPGYVEADARRSITILWLGVALGLLLGVAFAVAAGKSPTSPG